MIAIYRWILGLMKKEHILRTNYHRSHPHFLLYIGLDAVLSFALVFGGIQIATSHSSDEQKLAHVGAVAIPSDELINLVKKENVDAYWLGPISEYKYTIHHEVSGIADISYLPKVSDQTNMGLFLYEVKTYKNKKVWDARTHTLLATSGTITITTTQGLSIKINPASMKGEIITFGDRSEIVGIAYLTPQSRQAMIKNAESLRPIQ